MNSVPQLEKKAKQLLLNKKLPRLKCLQKMNSLTQFKKKFKKILLNKNLSQTSRFKKIAVLMQTQRKIKTISLYTKSSIQLPGQKRLVVRARSQLKSKNNVKFVKQKHNLGKRPFPLSWHLF